MSTSIRPPGGPSPGMSGLEGVSESKAPDAASPSGAASVSANAPASAGAATGAQGPTATWLSKLEKGEVSRAEAIEGLVAQALEAHGGARLPPAQRAELEAVLKAALLDDPVLGRLLGGT